MPRYFITTNASRNYNAGGFDFPFEPVSLRGGVWLGVLAVDEESKANILLQAGFSEVAEINDARYESLKKKYPERLIDSPTLPGKPLPLEGVAGVVGRSSAHGAGDVGDPAKNPNATHNLSAVGLLSGEATPPHEPLLEQAPTRRPRIRTR